MQSIDHHFLDDYACRNALREIDARIKLILGLGGILIAISADTPYAPLFVGLTLSCTTVFLAKIPIRLYLALLMIPASFALMSVVVILFLTGGGDPILTITLPWFSLAATTDAALYATLILTRAIGGTCGLLFIALTTPMIELFSILRSLRLPAEFIDLAMLLYRSIFVIIGEAVAIYNAQVMRNGYSSFRQGIFAISMLASSLFIRAWDRGEDLLSAMDARCYDGKFEILEPTGAITASQIIPVIIFLSLSGILVLLPIPFPL
ncbi:cobalt ECF transporter T component CbiQ [Methanocalculus sp.]|uniref:cobalt ECF transporter T component CbiQ n=1 Tax=Methanocalculus sp. TaxID=2004547 RepID=UPI002719D762|nr:cobalt ECF transporter T component CbiQ [Methanocalculus sp.]MDO8841166.1 cobalt ECF transporter T component CbiQ [Methanocalculus sp.]